jgi:hypothetical protein
LNLVNQSLSIITLVRDESRRRSGRYAVLALSAVGKYSHRIIFQLGPRVKHSSADAAILNVNRCSLLAALDGAGATY